MRLWGIGFGLPYDGVTYNAMWIEEIQEVHRALKLGAGEYTWVFGKGGLYLILFVEYGVLFAVSWAAGWVSGPREFAIQALQDPTALYVAGRVTVALMGVATCYVAYALARRVYDEKVALGAMLIGALAYFHALFSALINVDVGCALFLWTSVLVYLRYEDTGKLRYLFGAGALGAVSVAFKFPGAVVLPLLCAAILTSPQRPADWSRRVRDCLIVFVTLVVAMTAIAPEWIPRIGWMIHYNFPWLLDAPSAVTVEGGDDIGGEIRSMTVQIGGTRLRYVEHLLRGYNVVLLAFALVGAAVAAFRKNRWDLILAGTVVVFILVMSLSARTQPEHYLFPALPALWILGSRGVFAIARDRNWLAAASLAAIVAIPAAMLTRAMVEKSGSDTRISAKQWVEAHVPNGSRILMDGMQYRFSQSPPLNPDKESVTTKVKRASKEGEKLGRGVSDLALSVYQEAKGRARGPTYDIVSTVHGLQVKPIDYYVAQCYGYIITSDMVAGRYAEGGRGRELFPKSTQFYDSLSTDPRVRLVHEEHARHWHESGPTIRIYDVQTACETAGH